MTRIRDGMLLIRRVLSDIGHLSNEQGASLLAEVVRRSQAGRVRHLVQLHLSRECNRVNLAATAAQQVVDRLGIVDVGAYYPHRVTYHASCHGLRGLALGTKPLQLLNQVRGIELVALEDVERCCGFGGTFAVKNAEVSTAMLADKVRSVVNTTAEVCTACDNSCLMHIQGMLHRQYAGVKTAHIAELLASEDGS